SDLIYQIPGPAESDFRFVLLITPLTAMIASIPALFVSMLMVYVHRVIKMGGYGYRIEKLGDKYTMWDMFKRGIVPGFFCWSLGLQILMILREDVLAGAERVLIAFNITSVPLSFIIAMFLVPVAALLWAPIWLLEDAGIVTYLKPETRQRRTPDVEGVGRYYSSYLNGFVGVTTIINLGLFLFANITTQLELILTLNSPNIRAQLLTLGMYLVIPFYVILAFSPLLLLHEYLLGKTTNRLINFLEKHGFIKKADDDIIPQEPAMIPVDS
ncbi:MAG: hypothetical protein ACTSW4_03785, partial [Candidatus Ranarchaeia archaeon]